MSRSGPRVALGIGLALIVLCVIAGVTVSKGGPDNKLFAATERRISEFGRLKQWTNVEAEAFAKDLLAVNDLHPAAISFDRGVLYFMIPLEPTLIDRIFSPGSRSYRGLALTDFDKAFEKRWKKGLSGQFGNYVNASGRSPAYFNSKFGQVELSWKMQKAGSSNPLDYLDFTFKP